ncbi:tetratricopeptide repeat protein [Galbibacter sp.]|uniref:tetratricopeptide repeat protein n=1 Tax=Galbibacter sp. TaxID=2918471 RepID=UPI003A93D20B
MIRNLFIFIFFALTSHGFYAQDQIIARQYFDEGNFEKAAVYYERFHRNNPQHSGVIVPLVETYQQLEKYQKAEALLLEAAKGPKVNPVLYIEIGYNYSLMSEQQKAEEYYNKAIASLSINPNYAYILGKTFRTKSLLEQAISTYKKAMELNGQLNFVYDLATIYGELGEVELMYSMYLELIKKSPNLAPTIKRNLGRFVTDDAGSENNISFKKAVLRKTQSEPDVLWNEMLSWMFVQQRDYKNAFVQQRAIYKRSEAKSLLQIVDLGVVALENEDVDTAKAIYEFIIAETNDVQQVIQAKLNLITLKITDSEQGNTNAIKSDFEKLLAEYGNSVNTLMVQIKYAKFLAFQMGESSHAEQLLKQALTLSKDRFLQAQLKITLADVLVYDEKFNQALIYYAQVQKNLKNDVWGQYARFKVAQTSFYKGDFQWAETQLNILKSSTSQLIANDALELKLLISDNIQQDSIHTALKLYAKADLLAYQNNTAESIRILQEILDNHKGDNIEDQALLKQGELFEQLKQYDKAALNFEKIIAFYSDGILMDDALFHLGVLNLKKRMMPEHAKKLFERIIFEHQDSIYFVQARELYRSIRGDQLE